MSKRIGNTGNRSGGVYVSEDDDGCFWGIENVEEDTVDWEKIPRSLYDELIKFQEGEDAKKI